MATVVWSRKNRDAGRVATITLPHVKLIPVIFLLVSTDQCLQVRFLKERLKDWKTEFDRYASFFVVYFIY